MQIDSIWNVIGSDGRLTLSGWLLNQLDSPGFAWLSKNLFPVREGYEGGPCVSRRFYLRQFALLREWERKRFQCGKWQPMGRPSRLNEHVISPCRYWHIQVDELTLLFTRGTTLGRSLRIDEYMTSPTVGILTGRASLRLSRIVAICAFPVVHKSSPLLIDIIDRTGLAGFPRLRFTHAVTRMNVKLGSDGRLTLSGWLLN